jgi:hypothetical protein
MSALRIPRHSKAATKLVKSVVASVITDLCHNGIAALQAFAAQKN